MLDVTHNAAHHQFEADTPDGLAFAAYERKDATVVFTHTEVPEEAEGQGVASALTRAALDWARTEGLSIVPMCPFFAAYMARHRETHDLVREADRKWLVPDYDEKR